MNREIPKQVPPALKTISTLKHIQNFSMRLASTTDKKLLFNYCLSLTKEILQLEYCTLFLLDEECNKLVLRATDGLPEEMVDSLSLAKNMGLPSYVLETGQAETVEDFSVESRFSVTAIPSRMDICSAIAAPMMISDKIFGVLIGHNSAIRGFSKEEKHLFQVLANHAAIAINNTILIDSLYLSEKKRERKIQELLLEKDKGRERSDEFESIFSNMMIGVVLLREGNSLARCNQKFAEMLGYNSVDELVGISLRKLHLTDEHYRDFGKRHYGSLFAGKIVQAEYNLKKKDGTPILCMLSGRSVDQSTPLDLTKGFVWVIDDVTKRKEMEAEVLQARKLESIGIMAGGIGHDFNNILSAILGNLGLAQRLLASDHKVQGFLGAALEAATKAKDLTAKLLLFTRRDSHNVGSVVLPELCQEVKFSRYLGEGVDLTVDFQPGLYAVKIMPDHLKAILQNLLLNADSCMLKGGKVVVKGRNLEILEGDVPGLARGRYVAIIVADNGSGINKEILEHIFDPYFTTKNRDSSRGIGLGLAIVHSIVKKSYGNISVQSSKEEGTVFTILLPAVINDILAFQD